MPMRLKSDLYKKEQEEKNVVFIFVYFCLFMLKYAILNEKNV